MIYTKGCSVFGGRLEGKGEEVFDKKMELGGERDGEVTAAAAEVTAVAQDEDERDEVATLVTAAGL